MNKNLVEKAIDFHGMPLQKVWDGERGDEDLVRMGLHRFDYINYSRRQRSLTFQDRTKRLKLHQLIAKKAEVLFNNELMKKDYVLRPAIPVKVSLPPLEVFCSFDVNDYLERFYTKIRTGDVAYGQVISRSTHGIIFKVLFTQGHSTCILPESNVKGYIPNASVTVPTDKTNTWPRPFITSDLICCIISEIQPDSRKITCSMKAEDDSESSLKLGLVTAEDFPDVYKFALSRKRESYDEILEKSPSFNHPACIDTLMQEFGLDNTKYYTNMSGLKGHFPPQEYASSLRQSQADKWAFRNVANGIEHFKVGRHHEAFQCLNKALSIDPKNVEGLVARGALYANSGSFKKAVDDFKAALDLNPNHANARKYMGETLVALGRSYEEENKLDDAKKAYQDCLAIIPHHEEAQNSLDFLLSKTSSKQIVEPGELEYPSAMSLMHDSKKEANSDNKKDKKSKKDKKKKHKKRRSSSSESSSSSDSSDSDSSSSSSSSSSSTTSGSDSNSRHNKKKKKSKGRVKSLSPLSKRMASMGNEGGTSSDLGFQFNQSFGASNQLSSSNVGGLDEYELKVRKFLEMPRDEEDYEEKVRRFVAEAAKYQKERKTSEEKSKKKKKKEEKKAKKESKKKRKSDDKKKTKGKKDKIELDAIENKKLRDALKIFESLPVLDELGSKLTEYYASMDKPGASTSKEKKTPDKLSERDDSAAGSGKWKMMFAKDENKEPSKGKSSMDTKKYAFANDSDESDHHIEVQKRQEPKRRSPSFERHKRRPSSPAKAKEVMAPSIVKSGPVVLDKFGNFRLATTEVVKPPSPARRETNRSRSRYSSSRSRSRSRKRHSRYSRSVSRSVSKSRSRSRSRSLDRHYRDRRPFRGRGGYQKPWYNSNRGSRYQPRGRAPFRSRPPYRSRYYGNNYRRSRSRTRTRSRSYSPDVERRRRRSASPRARRSRSRNNSKDRPETAGKWTEDREKRQEDVVPSEEMN